MKQFPTPNLALRSTPHCGAKPRRHSIRRALLALCLAPAAVFAAAGDPPPAAAFRTTDGAYTVSVGGDVVDPYFVNKALIIALESGAGVSAEVNAWLGWLLPRQRADGGFDRYCGAQKRQWRACMPADADDAMAATLIQLIALAEQRKLLGNDIAQPARRASARARQHLTTMLDRPSSLYRVFANRPVYYLMDNAEVYTALLASGESSAARQLATAMRRGFVKNGRWQPAIPAYDKPSFYPHILANSYLWQGKLVDTAEAGADMAAWLAQHSRSWLNREHDRFAWGLVAWNIATLAPAEAGCWRRSVHPLPSGVGWTVLDAFADQALARRGIAINCTRALDASPATGS